MGKGTKSVAEVSSEEEEIDESSEGSEHEESGDEPKNTAPQSGNTDPSQASSTTDIGGQGLELGEDHNFDPEEFNEEDRAELLKRELVIEYRRNKGKNAVEDLPPDEEKSFGQKLSEGVDYVTTAAGLGFEGESIAKSVKEYKGGTISKGVDKAASIGSFVNSGAMTLNSLYRTKKNYDKLGKSRKAQKKSQAKKAFWGSVGTSASLAMSTTSKGLKLFGKTDNAKQMNWAKYLDLASAAAGLVGSSLSLAAGKSAHDEHNRIVNASNQWGNDFNNEDTSREENLSQEAKAAKDAGNTDLYEQKVRERNDYKAKKYAMGMAHDFNDIKGKQMVKGGFGFAASLLNAGRSAMKSFAGSKFLKSGLGVGLSSAMGGIASLLNAVGKVAEKKSDAKAAEDTKTKKLFYVNKYIQNKTAKLDSNFDGLVLTDNEKQRIVIARLGLDIPITDDDLDEGDKLSAFKLLALKRARNILNASDDTKQQMLTALGLSGNPSAEEIAEVMTGE